jgi:2'-hydroxyisoflavone reductase
MKILIIGGSRFMGPLLVAALSSRGHAVTVFNRGTRDIKWPKGITVVQGDRNEGFNFSESLDAVIDTCAYNPEHIEQVFKDIQTDYYLFVSSAVAYKKAYIFPITEESPLGEWPLWRDYNAGKVACEKYLEKSGKPYGGIRPVYILGKKNHVPRESFIYSALRKRGTITLPGDGLALAQFVFVEEVVQAMLLLAESKKEGSFNCCGNEAITLQGLVEEMAKIVGVTANIEYDLGAAGENHQESEFPFANEHFFCSNQKLKALGVSFGPLIPNLKRDYEAYYEAITRP